MDQYTRVAHRVIVAAEDRKVVDLASVLDGTNARYAHDFAVHRDELVADPKIV